MTERRHGAPDEPRSDEDGPPEADADRAEASSAEAEVEPVEADVEPVEAESLEAEPADDDETIVVPVAAPLVAPSPPARGADRVGRRPERAPAAPPPPSPSDQAVHINDRASKFFVLGTVLVFLLILLNGALFGVGGALSPTPSPTPRPSPTVAPSPSLAPSGSPASSGSPSASGSPAPSIPASPAASLSPAPS